MAAVTRRKLIIDVDVGGDDAIAVMLCAAAEKQGLINILGITCVNGNTSLDNVCRNTVKTLRVINRLDIPVFRGAASPLSRKSVQRADHIHGSDGFGDFEDKNIHNEEDIQKEHAVNALIRIVNENPALTVTKVVQALGMDVCINDSTSSPFSVAYEVDIFIGKGEVTLLCVAPLTNIALAMKMDPTFTEKVKEIYIMGGNIEGYGNASISAEFNFFCDPEAAYVVLEESKCSIVLFPWEAAYKHGQLSLSWRRDVLGSISTPEVELMNKVEKTLFDNKCYSFWGRCDPQAAAAFLSPSFVLESQTYYATVELQGQHTRGQMVLDHAKKTGKPENITVIKRIDMDKYKKLLLWAMGGPEECPL